MAADYIRYANQGATRNLPLDSRLIEAFRFLPELGVSMEVFSGGQPAKGSGLPRVGSTRHDHGHAADVFFRRGDQRLDWANPEHQPIFQDIVARAKAAGVTGFGAGPGYMQPGSMHVGFGNPGVWGAGGKGANAPSWLRAAYEGGAAPTIANMQNKSFDPVGEVVAAAGPSVPPLDAPRTVGSFPVAQAGAPQGPQMAFGDVVVPQQPASFTNFIDSYNRRRQAAEEEEQARQSRLAALFASLPA